MSTIFLLAALAFVEPVAAAPPTSFDKLVELRKDYDALQVVEDRKLMNLGESEVKKQMVMDAVKQINPDLKTYDKLHDETQGFVAKITGFVTFRNILLVSACGFFAVAVFWLCGIYLVAILIAIPVEFYEVLCYFACGWAVVGGMYVSDAFVLAPVLPGALGLMGCLSFTHSRHFSKHKAPMWFYSLLLCAAWSVIAVFYHSQVIGFMAVAAFLSACGFICGMVPGIVWIGFDKDDAVIRGTVAAFLILSVHVITNLMHVKSPHLMVFRPGMEFMGTFVYFLGILILADKHYWTWGPQKNLGLYWPMNAVAVISVVAALYLGSVYGMGSLLGVGGTFFYLWILEKYYDIPWQKEVGFAWSLLGLSLLLYGGYVFAVRHPEYFIW